MAAVAHDDESDGYEGYGRYGRYDGYDGSSGEARRTLAQEEIAEILGQSWSTPTQAALDQVAHGLAGLGLPADVRQAMLAVLTSTAAHTDPHPRAGDEPRGQLTGDEPRGQRSTARVALVEVISDQDVLAAAHGTRVLTGFAEGALIETARTLADRAGTELLARKHLHDPAELSPTARAKWQATTKSLVAQELSTLTGHGIQAAHTIVAFALAPPTAVAAANTALRTGKTDWRAVSAFWSRCRALPHTTAADVDTAVFGPLLTHPTPDNTTHPDSSTDSTDPGQPDDGNATGDGDGDVGGGQDVRRESWAEFSRRLEREAVRAESADHAVARQRRRAALSRRDVHARIGEHGTGDLTLTGATTSVAGAVERLETIARAAKAAGDERSLGQIRSDTAYALLIHGILPLPGASTNCTSTCTGTTGSTGSTGSTGATNTTPSSTAPPPASQTSGSTTGQTTTSTSTTGSATGSAAGAAFSTGNPARSDTAGSAAGSAFSAEPLITTPEDIYRIITGQPAISVEVIVPASFLTGHPHTPNPHTDTPNPGGHDPDAATSTATGAHGAGTTGHDPAATTSTATGIWARRMGGVGEIIGYGFLTGEHAQELIATPGSTLHRLLTDPADGRLIERTITAYRPDAAMITQLRATDVFCRAPGCLIPARRCDIDHEHEHSTGGPTTEPNLGHKHRPHHQAKTARFWATLMNATRDVTWRTLFGRMYTTRAHDYHQYDPPPRDSTPDGNAPSSTSSTAGSRPDGWVDPASITNPDTRDQLIYAALSTRTGHDQWLEAIDDDPQAWTPGHDRPLILFHHAGGRRRPGPPPGQPAPEQLINPTPPPAPDPGPPPPF